MVDTDNPRSYHNPRVSGGGVSTQDHPFVSMMVQAVTVPSLWTQEVFSLVPYQIPCKLDPLYVVFASKPVVWLH